MKKICIGIDIAKEKFDVTAILLVEATVFSQLGYQQFKNVPAGFRGLVTWIRKFCKANKLSLEDCLFCMETTGGYDRGLCNYLYGKSLNVWRESALQIRRSSGFRRGKDDKADSHNIAEYAARYQDRVQTYVPDDAKIMELKEILTYRDSLVERRKEAKVRSEEKAVTCSSCKSETTKFIAKLARTEIRQLDKMIDDCEKQVMVIIGSDETLKRNYDHIISVKGLGMINAAAIIAYSGNFKKIATAAKMACYIGAVTFYEESGTSIHKRDSSKNVCCKRINNYLRMAAKCAIRNNDTIKAYAEKLKKRGKTKNIVTNNVVHKLLKIVYSLIKNDCDFETEHEWKRSQRKELDCAKYVKNCV